jgi:hypothetical protein
MFVVNKSSVGPQLPADFLSRQQLAGPLQQQAKHLKRLRVQLDPEPISCEALPWLRLLQMCRSDSAVLSLHPSCSCQCNR